MGALRHGSDGAVAQRLAARPAFAWNTHPSKVGPQFLDWYAGDQLNGWTQLRREALLLVTAEGLLGLADTGTQSALSAGLPACPFESRLIHMAQSRISVHFMSRISVRLDRNKERGSYAPGMGFGDRLKSARKARGMSGVDLGAALEVSKQTISNWEHGRNQPDLDQLAKICQVLHVTADSLVLAQASEVNYSALQVAVRYSRLSPREQQRWHRLLEAAKDDPSEKGHGRVVDEGETWSTHSEERLISEEDQRQRRRPK